MRHFISALAFSLPLTAFASAQLANQQGHPVADPAKARFVRTVTYSLHLVQQR
ncbi:hypothetical protein [Endozoicomonas montiporae]|uniref:hypothetical protein n=1 Tax=Endozoicomonas montiporae TaxID=1027273 RepID=UPI000A8020A1|nr:hypothetical protein [Endozoicomonas montiporae]